MKNGILNQVITEYGLIAAASALWNKLVCYIDYHSETFTIVGIALGVVLTIVLINSFLK